MIDFNKYHWFPENYHKPFTKTAKDLALEDLEISSLAQQAFDHVGGRWAWIAPNGTIFRVHFASHDWVAEFILGQDVQQFEKTHGRFSHFRWQSAERCFETVARPTSKQYKAYAQLLGELND